MKKAVIMCRVSTDEQAQKGYSLSVQLESMTRYCKHNDIEILKIYKEDHSAKNFNRPEFKRFLQFAKEHRGEIDYLLITTWDRFSRNLSDSLLMLEKLKKIGIEPLAIEQPIDLSIPENKAMLAMFLVMPEIDNDRRSIKVRGGIRGALKAGRWPRHAPKGYKNTRDEENKPIIVPNKDAKHINYIYESFDQGNSQASIIKDLKGHGIEVSRNNISKILRNTVYIGKVLVPASEDEEEMLIEGLHEAIIPKDLFYGVQDILSGNKRNRNRPKFHKGNKELFLRGNLQCSKCGKPITGSLSRSSTGKRYPYYHCNHCKKERFSSGTIHTVMEAIFSGLHFKSEVKQLFDTILSDQLNQTEPDRITSKKELQKEIGKQAERIVKLQDMLIDGTLEKSDYQTMKTRYQDELNHLTLELNDMEESSTELQSRLEKGLNLIYQFKATFIKADTRTKQQLVRSIFPENFGFDGKNCRTTRINEVVRLMLVADKALGKNKRGQFLPNLELSPVAAPRRIELLA